jgi:PIN domain nuclease of toxin-antitoxin system
MIYLDTHVVVRLYLGELNKLGTAARKAIEEQDLMVSSAAILELEYLHQIGRLKPNASKVVSALEENGVVRICEVPFRTVVEHALKENWARDPFDRLMVANAKASDASLITKDEKIHRYFSRAVW